MTTVKERLAEIAAREKAEREDAEWKRLVQIAHEEQNIEKVEKFVTEALDGFEYTVLDDHVIWVGIRARSVYISIKYETETIHYADDCRGTNKRVLKIGIGFSSNQPILYTGEENFVESFIRFLKSERLV